MIIEDIKKQILSLELKLMEIQEACTHPDPACSSYSKSRVETTEGGATIYDVHHHCLLCDKQWDEVK